MARITSKQAKEMNEAYAKVYQNLQEESEATRIRREKIAQLQKEKEAGGLNKLVKKEAGVGDQSFKKGAEMATSNNTSNTNNNTSNTKTPVKTQNNQTTEKPASGGLKTLSGNDSKLSSDSQQKVLAMKNAGNNNQSSSAPNGSGGKRKVDGKALMDKLKADSGDRVQSSGNTPPPKPATGGQPQGSGQQSQSGVNRSQTVVKDGNKTTTTTRTSADDSTPEGAAAVKDFKTNRAERLNRLRSGGGLRPDGEGPSTGGTPPSTQSGGQPPAQGAKKPGLLGRLGSLAGKAVGAARNVAGNVKQGAQAVAGGIKQGAQAVSGALANKGPIQGRQTGAQRRAQQTGQTAPQATQTQQTKPVPQAQPAPQAQQARPAPQAQQARPAPQAQPAQQAKPVQAAPAPKPVPQAQPAQQQQSQRPSPMERRNARLAAAKSKGSPLKRPGAQRAMQMAKAKQSAPAPAPVAQKRPGQGGITRSSTWDSYDPVFDDTVQFLVSEGHAKDVSEAMSIMSESEFIDAFNQELNG